MAAVAPPPGSVSQQAGPSNAQTKPEPAADEKPAAASEKSSSQKTAEVKAEADEKKEADGANDQAKSPSRGKSAEAGEDRERPGLRSGNKSNFDLEPNPFEQSFSRGSQSGPSGGGPPAEGERTTPPRGGDATSLKHNSLPPLSSLTSPAAADPSQFPWLAGQSLRSGPLSPAMLAGPQQGSQGPTNNANNTNNAAPAGANAWGPAGNNTEENAAGEENFEPGNFRTGFTPGTGTGFTPGYSALLNSNFPMPSPNTAAFLNSITNVDSANDANANNGGTAPGNNFANGEPRQPPSAIPPHLQHQPHGMSHLNPAHNANANAAAAAGPTEPTITPNTLSALTGAVASELSRQQPPPNGIPNAFYPPGPVPGAPGGPLPPPPMGGPVDYAQQNANAASQAANGLFLLSQAHQELSKREEEAKSSGNTPVMSKRNVSNTGPKPQAGQKRKDTGGNKGGAAKKGKKQDEKEDSSTDGEKDKKPAGNRNETEEEKRRNFLERNRQAALKCRQRKKAWLNELQNKVETLSVENERLQGHCRQLEDELQRMSSILVQHRDCGVGMPQMAPAYGRPLR
ncbi:activating transcription factor 2 [Trichosporon asahii var. asahii CBS 2479]|uniref:Activating transcription factor 2 n=1 Tax=Trichosporon asahii var. asahii (strain ATCC 90039 / CBS 2479 / JCM 2466 / KCTC 7840 / NBRC 103889/ NCYC 2677 / UAMH 7654) TaxID=1186058 RepID=J4UIX7_TRIAS|nr:activating transcription factor 2 [Trichosporon asahii var. asahii CBS 2479]EJT51675.1 activating transcription factor 2 [Trichosporon asahii var. asahii CBS 2479]